MAVNIGPRIGIDGEAEYRKQISNIIQQTRTLKSEYEKVTSATDSQNNSLKKNAEQHKILAQQIEAQKERIKKLGEMVKESSDKFGESDTKTLRWKEALNQAETELNNLESKLRDLPSSLQLIGDRMQEMGDKIQGVGSNIKSMGSALTPLSTTATAAIAGSVKVFADFESQMSRVKAISGATGDEFETLTAKARDMGASTKFTATEAGQAFEYMAMAGWKSEQMLDGIAPVMNLAAASGEELGTVSDIVTDALTAFGLEAKDATEFTDVLAATATNANTNVGMMGESFKYAASVAGSMGYSIQDVSLALGLMANSGIKADQAGTALRNMIQRMAKPTKESADAMSRLGVSLTDDEGRMLSLREIMDQMRKSFGHINMPIEDFQKAVENLNGQLEEGEITEEKYNKEIEELAKQAYGAEGAEKARAAAMLAGARAMPALLSIVNTGEADYRKLASAIDNSSGAAKEMADTMIDNTAGAVTIMKSAVEGAGIELGEVFAPYVTKAAEKVQELAVKFSNMTTAEQESIAKNIAFAAAAAPALKAIGGMTEGVGKLVSVGGQFTEWLGKTAGAPELALFTVGVAAVTGGIMALQKSIDDFRTENINQAMSKALVNEGGIPIETAFENITAKITDMSGGFEMVAQKSAALEQAKGNVTNLVAELDKITTSLDAGVMTAEEAAPQLETILGQLADAISAKMGAAGDVLLATFSEDGVVARALEQTGRSAQDMREQIVQSMDEQQRKVYELQETMANADYGSQKWKEAHDELLTLNAGTDAFKQTVTGFNDYVASNPVDWSKYFNGETFDMEAFRTDLQATTDKTREFKDNLQQNMTEAYAAADQLNNPALAAAIRETLPSAYNQAMGDVSGTTTEMYDMIQNQLIGGIDEQIRQAEEAWAKEPLLKKLVVWNGDEGGYIKSQLNQYKTDTIDPISGDIETAMNELGVSGAGWASEAASEIIDGLFNTPNIEQQAQGAQTTLKTNWETVLNNATSEVKGVAEERGKDVVDGFNQGINNNAQASETQAQTWMERFKQAIHDSVMRFGSPSQTAADFGKDTVDGFNQGVEKNEGTSTSTVSGWMGSIKSTIGSQIPGIVSKFGEIKSGITKNMDETHAGVKSAWDQIKALFNQKLEFPKIKMPHFRITGDFNLNPPRVPSISVDWYAKAMASGMRLDGATIFGAAGDKLLGGGEAGPEWIVGENSLIGMINGAVRTGMGYINGGNTVTIGDTNIIINAEGQDAEEIADRVDEIITARLQQAEATWA